MRALLRDAAVASLYTLVLLAYMALMLAFLDGGVPDWEAECRMQRLPGEASK